MNLNAAKWTTFARITMRGEKTWMRKARYNKRRSETKKVYVYVRLKQGICCMPVGYKYSTRTVKRNRS